MNTEAVKTALEHRLEELKKRALNIEDEISAKPDSDLEDNAIDSEDDEVLAHLGDLTLNDMHNVRVALGRLAMGHYGRCVSCGGSIGDERLEALPHATRCIGCA